MGKHKATHRIHLLVHRNRILPFIKLGHQIKTSMLVDIKNSVLNINVYISKSMR